MINDPAFRAILGAAAQMSADPATDKLAAECARNTGQLRELKSANQQIDSKAKKAVIFIITCFILMVLLGVIRIFLSGR